MRTTHTCAVLQLSPAAYAEIRSKLEAAGYQHAFEDGDGDGEWIDMSGIGVQADPGAIMRALADAKEALREAGTHIPGKP